MKLFRVKGSRRGLQGVRKKIQVLCLTKMDFFPSHFSSLWTVQICWFGQFEFFYDLSCLKRNILIGSTSAKRTWKMDQMSESVKIKTPAILQKKKLCYLVKYVHSRFMISKYVSLGHQMALPRHGGSTVIKSAIIKKSSELLWERDSIPCHDR